MLLEAILDEPWIKDLAGSGKLAVDPEACHLEQEIFCFKVKCVLAHERLRIMLCDLIPGNQVWECLSRFIHFLMKE